MGLREQKTGAAATLSIFAAAGSYLASCGGRPGWGLFLAIVAIPLGLLGLVIAASPRVKGGVLSIIAIVLGLVGVLVAILGIVGVILF